MAHLAGQPIKKVVLTMRKAGNQPLEHVKLTMEDCIVTAFDHDMPVNGGDLTEKVSFQFARVRYEYTPQKQDGSGGPTVTTAWDIAANKKA